MYHMKLLSTQKLRFFALFCLARFCLRHAELCLHLLFPERSTGMRFTGDRWWHAYKTIRSRKGEVSVPGTHSLAFDTGDNKRGQ